MNIIWDIEQMLLNAMPGISNSMRRTLRAMGCDDAADQQLDWITELPIRDAFAVLTNQQQPALLDQAETLYYQQFQQYGRFEAEFYPNAERMLSLLDRDPSINAHYVTHIGKREVAALLKRYKLAGKVKQVYTGSDYSCPHHRLSLLSEVHGRVAKANGPTVVISECPRELRHAKMLGVASIGIGYSPVPSTVIARAEPDYIASCPIDALVHISHIQKTGGRALCH